MPKPPKLLTFISFFRFLLSFFLQARRRHDCHPFRSGMFSLCTASDMFNCCKLLEKVANQCTELVPLPPSFLLLSLPRRPSIPQVLASLRTVRSNFTILANVTTPTNKSVSCCQTPLPPTYTRHDCLLSLQCVFANVSFSSLPWEILLPSWLTNLWLSDCAQGKYDRHYLASPQAQRTPCLRCMSLTLYVDDGDGQ